MDRTIHNHLRLAIGLGALLLAVAGQSLLSRRVLTADAGWLFLFGTVALVVVFPPLRVAASGDPSPARPLPRWLVGGSIALALGGILGFFFSELDYLPRSAFINAFAVAAVMLGASWLAAEWRSLLAYGREVGAQIGPAARQARRSLNLGFMAAGIGFVAVASAYWLRDQWGRDPLMTEAALLWLAGVALFCLGIWRGKGASGVAVPFRLDRTDWLVLAVAVAIGAWLRFYQLADLPYGSWYDEAEFGLEGIAILNGKPFSPVGLYTPFNPALFFYLVGLSFKLFGVGILQIRLVAAFAGLITIPFVYLLVRLMLDRRTAAIAAVLVAASAWHVNFSRFGMQNIITTPLAALAFFFLVRGYQTRSSRQFLLAGITFGLGMLDHTAFRMVLVMAALLIVHWAASDRRFLRAYLPNLTVLASVTVLLLVPLGMFAAQHSEELNRRLSQTWILVGKNTQPEKIEAIRNGFTKHFLMFNYQGDPNGRHGRPGAPVMDFAAGALMVLGLGYSLYHWRRWPYFLLFVWFFLALSAGMLTIDWEAPQAARSIAIVPAVYILAAIPLALVWRAADEALPRAGRALPALMVAGVLGFSTYANYDLYFNQQMRLNEVWTAFSGPETAEARTINQLDQRGRYRYYFGNTDAPVVRFLTERLQRPEDFRFFNPYEHLPLREKVDKDIVYIVEPWRVSIPQAEFLRYYPDAQTGEFRDLNNELLFFHMVVKKEDIARIQGLEAMYTGQGQSPFMRTDPGIDMDWTKESPSPDRPFRVEWTGTLFAPQAGQYTFSLQTAGPGTLELDRRPVASNDRGGAVEGRLYLAKGMHAIRVVDEVWPGSLRTVLSWALPSGPREVVPQVMLSTVPLSSNGLAARYYAGPNWQGDPRLVSIDQNIQFRWHPTPLDGAWSVEWRGQVQIPTGGEYEFNTRTNELAWLYIDGQPLIERGQGHTSRRITLAPGRHKIMVRYVSTRGYSEMRLFWTPPGQPTAPVPGGSLFPEE